MLACRSRTGQQYDLEDYPHQLRPGFEEGFDPDMYVMTYTVDGG
jgi:hypothetical protein